MTSRLQIKSGKVYSFYTMIIVVVIAQWLARRLANGEVPGSNPGKGEDLLISD